MTVRELIKALQELPEDQQDLPVVTQNMARHYATHNVAFVGGTEYCEDVFDGIYRKGDAIRII